MDPQDVTYIAIDVAKNSLQVKCGRKSFRATNDRRGIDRLIARARKCSNPFFVLEATGGYERLLMDMLHEAGMPLSLVPAARVRDFARSEGIRAKNDRIDADVIHRFALEKELRPTAPRTEAQKELTALMDRREHLSEQLKREKTRHQNSSVYIRENIEQSMGFLEQQIAIIDERIHKVIRGREGMAKAYEILTAIKGVGHVTAASLIAYMPEIAFLRRNQVVAIAGLAPFDRESGNGHRKRQLFGGRAKVRRVLYLAACSAATHNPVINAYVRHLVGRGKTSKYAIVAAMRKLLIHAHQSIKNHEISLA